MMTESDAGQKADSGVFLSATAGRSGLGNPHGGGSSSRTVHVELGPRSYDIHVGVPLENAPPLPPPAPSSALLVVDAGVAGYYLDGAMAWLRGQGVRFETAIVPAGESSKSVRFCEPLWNGAASAGLDRQGMIVALGGGVIGDLAGFAAATFLRGIRFAQIPTTLLAMVDSAVGGKTGIDLPAGKNLVGSFHQPSIVLSDVRSLETLPVRQLRSGMAEVVKYGAALDADFYAFLEMHGEELIRKQRDTLVDVVARCCEIKARVVGADECEKGSRAILNFGHTLGHALEKTLGYGFLAHGEAVALGMLYAASLSRDVLGLPADGYRRLADLLRLLGLPVSKNAIQDPGWDAIRHAMSGDKKSAGGSPRFVLLEHLGKARFGCEVSEDVMRRTWIEMP